MNHPCWESNIFETTRTVSLAKERCIITCKHKPKMTKKAIKKNAVATPLPPQFFSQNDLFLETVDRPPFHRGNPSVYVLLNWPKGRWGCQALAWFRFHATLLGSYGKLREAAVRCGGGGEFVSHEVFSGGMFCVDKSIEVGLVVVIFITKLVE